VPTYVLAFLAPCFIGMAVVLAVIRANKDDLPDIVRAFMRMGPKDGGGEGPLPALNTSAARSAAGTPPGPSWLRPSASAGRSSRNWSWAGTYSPRQKPWRGSLRC
jgi:hypothetical protein